jgi:NAD(P)-dependent dehydrogenase (short-subunit alcohol dehydrogenase family)
VILIEPGGFKTGIWEELQSDIARREESSYAAGYSRLKTLFGPYRMFMGEPEGVAKAIGKAMTARSPRARYLVGRDAQAIAIAQPLVPTVLRDRITRIVLGL